MFRLIFVYGAIAGLIVAVPMVWMMLNATKDSSFENGALYGYLTMIVALTAVFLGVKQYRDKALGGVIKFGPAVLVGLGISAVASLFYVVGWEISIAFSDFDFTQAYTKSIIDAAKAKGASDEEIREALEAAQSFATAYKNPLFRMPITFIEMFPVGVLISLISAAILRNSRVLPARSAA
jgi:hypothetical protein